MSEQSGSRIHPLVAGAAVGVILLSLVGVAAITGYLPGSKAEKAPEQEAATAPAGGKAAPASGKAGADAGKPAPKQVVAHAAQTHAQTQTQAKPHAKVCAECGVVVDVKQVEVKGQGSGVGAVAGGVVGAVVGNQFGHGDGRTVMTVAGAAGGAFAGNEIEKHARTTKRFDVAIRMDDGAVKTVAYEAQPAWRSGDKVRLVNGKLESAK